MPIFCRKNVHSLRNTMLLCQLKNKNHEKPSAFMPIFDQKTSILSKQHYILSQRSQQDALFFQFLTKKSQLLCPYFVKNVHSLKNTLLTSLYFVKKTSTLLKTKCSHVIFFIFFHKNPILLCPYLVKKRIFCQN